MATVVLIPGILCIIALLWGRTTNAFLNVFLPVLLVLPTSYYWTWRPLPYIGFMEATLVPLGVGLVLMDIFRWKVSRVDLWMLIFVFTSGYAEYTRGETTGSIMSLFTALTNGLVPYIAGKLLAEQPGIRLAVVRRYLWLLLPVCLLAMVQFFTKSNAFQRLWVRFFPDEWYALATQTREGFGRLGGPYFGAEQAGMVILIGLTLAIWLKYNKDWLSKYGGRSFLLLSKRAKFVIFVLTIALIMTQSRGPWIGAIFSVGIASIGTAKKPLQRVVVLIALILLVGVPGYIAGKDYASGPRKGYTDSEKETAQYRAQLIDNYIPLAKLGGAWGWGPLFPKIGGQTSIDNEYLFVWLVQGYVGLFAFILILLETSISLIRLGIKAKSKHDRSFVFSLLGVIFGLALTLATVFLGPPNYNIFFLLIGWCQSIRLSHVDKLEDPEAESYQVETESNLIRVYT